MVINFRMTKMLTKKKFTEVGKDEIDNHEADKNSHSISI
jgi:hypothetical protein